MRDWVVLEQLDGWFVCNLIGKTVFFSLLFFLENVTLLPTEQTAADNYVAEEAIRQWSKKKLNVANVNTITVVT